MPRVISYMLDGKKLDHDGFVDPDVEEHCYLDDTAGLIRSFGDRNAFLKAFQGAGLAGNIQQATNKLKEAKAHYDAINDERKDALAAQQVADYSARQQTIRELFKKKGVNPVDHKALISLHHAGEIGSMVVYDRPGCVGDWAYFTPGAYPKLSWFGWNDRVSSFFNIGVLASLHQDSWFRQKVLWVPPLARYKDLGWWSNRISSMIFYA